MPQQYPILARDALLSLPVMIDFSDERLFALQQEYDKLEVALMERLPEFPLYLASRKHDERRRYERHFSPNADFQRWQALAEQIAKSMWRGIPKIDAEQHLRYRQGAGRFVDFRARSSHNYATSIGLNK